MNTEQIKSAARIAIYVISGALGMLGWSKASDLSDLFLSETTLSAVAIVVTAVFSLWSRTDKSIILAAAKTEAVAKVELKSEAAEAKQIAKEIREKDIDAAVVVK